MIDFSMTPEQESMLDTVDRYCKKRLPLAEILRRDREHIPPYDLLPEMGELGILGLVFDPKYGGMGEQWMTLALIQERIGQHAYFAASIISRVVAFGGMALMSYGTEEQKKRWLPELIAGRALFALALSESQAGSDAAAIVTHAERVNGGWKINGRKTWISDAMGASHLVVPVRTEKGSKGSKGITAFLVPCDTTGISMTLIEKVGNACMPSFDIGFDDVVVDDSAMMGEEGRGFAHMLSTLHYSRSCMAAVATGCAQKAVNLAISHANEREQFGRPIGKFQVIRHRLADMQMRVDQSRFTMLNLAWLITEDKPCRRQASQAKVIATEALQYVTHHGMQILASAGLTTESDMQRMWRDGRLYTFGEGTNEIQRELIARELGL